MNQRVHGATGPRRRVRSTPPPEFYSIRRLDQVRALAHPLRLRLLELFALEPRTTKQAAEVLGEKPTRLYHHVALLEEVGLLKLRETRQKRGTTEKYYEAVASLLSVDSSLFRSRKTRATKDPKRTMAVDLLEEAKAELAACSNIKDAIPPAVMRLTVRGRATRLAAFRKELLAWLKVWAVEAEAGEGRSSELTVTLALVPRAGAPPSRKDRPARGKPS